MVRLIVRDEMEADRAAIRAVVEAAFGQPDEANLVEMLRTTAGTISLVAEETGDVLGHIALSPMQAPFRALGLAPVSVTPERQGQGIGSALIREGVLRAKSLGYAAIFVLGDEGYYGRFGFDVPAAGGYTCRYAGPHFARLKLSDEVLPSHGSVEYAKAFDSL